jgi:hypothetical protein
MARLHSEKPNSGTGVERRGGAVAQPMGANTLTPLSMDRTIIVASV